jgi:two-component system, OmpR family, response regulator
LIRFKLTIRGLSGATFDEGAADAVTDSSDASEGLAAIESAIRGHEIEIRRADAVEPIERLYVFAGWTLEETTRDLVSPAGRRVDLTSSEFDLLMAFLRQPGQALSRDALLGVLRGREWTYFDRSIDTLVARLRKKLADGADRPPLVRSVRGVGYVFCAAVSRLCDAGQSAAVPRLSVAGPSAVPTPFGTGQSAAA